VTASHYFVSYSRVDGESFVDELADALETASYPLWVDRRRLRPGDWDDQIAAAIKGCRGLVFVLSNDSAGPDSGCKAEWTQALKYKKPVIPIVLHAGAEMPMLLGPRQKIDFTASFDRGLAELREYLRWLESAEGALQELRHRLRDAERELPRADDSQRPRFHSEIEDLTRQIDEQRRALEDPEGASLQTARRIEAGKQREREAESVIPSTNTKFVNPPPTTAPAWFQDRHQETKLVGDFLRTEGIRLITIVGRGGVGKTAMVCRLLKRLEHGRLPDDLGDLPVDGIVYLSPTGNHPPKFATLFLGLCQLLPTDTADRLRQRYVDSHETPRTLMLGLLESFPAGHNVVLMDNFEDLVDPSTFTITNRSLREALETLITAPEHGVQVILTTQVVPTDLQQEQPARQRILALDRGLPSPYAERILREMDGDGSLGLRDASADILALARTRTQGYPRALEALAGSLRADRNTTLPELLDEASRLLPDKVIEGLVGEAYARLDPLAQQVMQALAIYVLPAPPVAIDYLLEPFRSAIDSAPVLGRLVNLYFARRDSGRYFLHQVDRRYALDRIPIGRPDDRDSDPLPFTQFGLRHRAAEYFAQTRKPPDATRTLEDLTAQLAEFDLRCQGEDFDTAADVLHEIDFECLIRWGHSRIAVRMHEQLQGKLTTATAKLSSITSLGNCYFSLSQFEDAVECYEQALGLSRAASDRKGEAAQLGNLGNCFYTQGDISKAIEHHRAALAISTDLDDHPGEANHLGNLGNCYYSLGDVRVAIGYHERSCAIERGVPNPHGEAIDLGNLGICYSDLGDFDRAIQYCTDSIAISRGINDRPGEATQLGNLGLSYQRLGQTEKAIRHYKEGLAISQTIGRLRGESHQLNNLAQAYSGSGDRAVAMRHYNQALEIADRIGDAQLKSEIRSHLALEWIYGDDLGEAAALAEAACGSDYTPSMAEALLIHGITKCRQGASQRARSLFCDCLATLTPRLDATPDSFQALDTKATALAGLALLGDTRSLDEAATTFREARGVTTAPGIVSYVLRRLDALVAADASSALAGLRLVAAGKDV